MKDIELPSLPHWCEAGSPFAKQMQAYARAAVEADRAQRVPEGKVLVGRGELNMVINALRRDAEQGRSVRGEMADSLLASTPAQPAQQERKPMTDAVVRERARLFLQAGRSYRGLWDAGVELASRVLELGFIEGAKAAERHHGIRE